MRGLIFLAVLLLVGCSQSPSTPAWLEVELTQSAGPLQARANWVTRETGPPPVGVVTRTWKLPPGVTLKLQGTVFTLTDPVQPTYGCRLDQVDTARSLELSWEESGGQTRRAALQPFAGPCRTKLTGKRDKLGLSWAPANPPEVELVATLTEESAGSEPTFQAAARAGPGADRCALEVYGADVSSSALRLEVTRQRRWQDPLQVGGYVRLSYPQLESVTLQGHQE